jgi:hypothetical protein
MRMRMIYGIIAATACVSISAVNANRESAGRDSARKPALTHKGGSIQPGSYRSPGTLRKVIVQDDAALAQAKVSGALELADYGSFTLLMVDEAALQETEQRFREASERTADPSPASSPFTVRDDLNVLLLRSGAIDTTADDAPGSLIGMGATASTQVVKPIDSDLRLIQFVGPVKSAWIRELVASGLEPIAYVPNNGYLVRGDSRSRDRLMGRNSVATARNEGFVQWEGPFLDSYKIHPALVRSMTERSEEVTVAVQLALGKREINARDNTEVQSVKRLASAVMVDAYGVLGFTNVRIKIDSARVADLAALPSVVNIEPWNAPQLFDERSSQIIAGELNSEGTAPRGPGYVAWLAAHGFSSAFSFGIDVSDSGIDRGVTTPDKLHPDFLDSNKQSRVVYARDYTSELDPADVAGHGTINLSIAGGSNMSTDSRDTGGFGYGIGVAPFALLGSSKIFQSNGRFDLIDPFTKLVSDAYRDGARVLSNSWGDISNTYSLDSQEYDLRVRDASPAEAGNQEIPICFAAGNAGPNKTIGAPSTAKNVISVAAGENARKDGVDGCAVDDSDADSAMDMAFFSSGGPLDDGRIKPDITAPGTHIEGAASQNADFDGSGVCGQAFDKPYFPTGQTLYTWSSGTSHSTPQVAGAAALVRQYLLNRGETPTAAFIKALMLNTATYMTGEQAGGNLPHPRQGWGLLNLNRAFDNTPRIFVNQTTTFNDSGQSFVITGEVKDTSQPFRVTLAWSDAPGFSGAAPWVNDLDLEVAINGQVYRGNNFSGQTSQPGGESDMKNNVEGVWLPAGTAGTFVVRVRATNIAGDGVPGNTDLTDQDFALVVYNGEKKDAPVAGISNIVLTGGADAFADPGDTCSMALRIENLSPNALNGAHGILTTTTTGVTITGNSSDFPNIAPGQSADGASPFVFTVDRGVACGSLISFVLDVTSQGLLSRVPFSLRVGRSQATDFFADDIESGESKWTHGSGIRKRKNRVDTWSISMRRVHAGASSWFTKDPGDKMTDAHLDTLPIQLPADAHTLQLVFFHTFEFERGAFDGGVIEISTGGDFEDLGSKIVKGPYTGEIFEFTSNPLAGQAAWVEGRLGAFQQVVVDLTSFAGKTVTIRFRIGTDSDGKGLGWYIDDVRIRGDRVSCTSPASE